MVRERVGDWRLAWRFVVAGLLAGLIVLAMSSIGLVDRPFYAAQDQLFPGPPPDPSITFIEVDSRSQKALGTFPWQNSYNARVINYLAKQHPKVILFDIPLDHLTGVDVETREQTDDLLAAAIKSAGNVVLVCTADVWPRPEFSTVAASVADRSLAPPNSADVVRGVPLRPEETCPQNEADESAFLQALRVLTGIGSPLIVAADGSSAQLGSHRIPLVDGQMLINFSRGSNHVCSYVDAYNASCPNTKLITDHIVIVGTKLIDAGDVYSQAISFPHPYDPDAGFCPSSRKVCMQDNQNYGYRILGDAIGTVLADRYVRAQPRSSVIFSVLLFALVVALWVYVLSFRRAVLFVAGALFLYYAAVILLSQVGYLADPIYAPIAIILAATFSLGARYVLEERERRKVERIFGRYVDPRIVLQLAASRSIEDIISRGERRDITLLFVDIRGFTAMSEGMSAEDVQSVIQDYLDDMSSLILKWDGTIDKYVGDEIVALWNAPVDQPDHALLAVRCAYDLVSQAPVLEARLASKGLPPISWGIGVNSGPAVVGNMGSKDRLQYTALGDTVNTASRFCGAAPAFNLLIGWATYQSCSDFIAVDEMPGLQLKGKSADTFRLFKVTAIRQDAASPWVEFPTEAALGSYSDHRQRLGAKPVVAVSTRDGA
jgi:adenylate cyclase